MCLQVDDQNRWNRLRKYLIFQTFHMSLREAVAVLEADAVVAVVMVGVGVVVYYLLEVVVNKILRHVDTSVEGLGSQVEILHLYM